MTFFMVMRKMILCMAETGMIFLTAAKVTTTYTVGRVTIYTFSNADTITIRFPTRREKIPYILHKPIMTISGLRETGII